MKLSRDQILHRLTENREAICRFGVRRLGIFGSYARDESNPGSDLDVIVEFEKKSFDGHMGLKEFLEELFGCHVDLVLRDSLKPALRDAILKETVDATGL